jgi:hypothetical protein
LVLVQMSRCLMQQHVSLSAAAAAMAAAQQVGKVSVQQTRRCRLLPRPVTCARQQRRLPLLAALAAQH